MSKPAPLDTSSPPFGKPSKRTEYGLLVRLTGPESMRAAPTSGIDYGRWYALWRAGWVTHERHGSVMLVGGLTVTEAMKDAARHAPPKPAPLEVAAAEYSTRHGRHYKAHLQASGLSQAGLARELAAKHISADFAWETRLKNFAGQLSPSCLTLAALADHFGVSMESFAAPLEAS